MWKYNRTEDMYSPELYHSADELYHYGVLGMRWHMHRAKKNGTTYTYESIGQKYRKRKAKKLAKQLKTSINPSSTKSKIEKNKYQLEILKERDRARQQYAKNTSFGRQVARKMIAGAGYKNVRAAGHDQFVSTLIGNTGLLPSYLVERSAAEKRVNAKKRKKK